MSASLISAQFLYKVSNALANVLDAPYVLWVSHIVYDIGRKKNDRLGFDVERRLLDRFVQNLVGDLSIE